VLLETLRLQIEKKNRAGKTVTVVQGFTRDQSYLENLSKQIKKSCGTGGTLKNQTIEIQGDFRPQIREILLKEGFQVRG
jgi:translation initiation factor 1